MDRPQLSPVTLSNMPITFPFGKTAFFCLSILLATSRLAAAQPTLLSFACDGKMKDGTNGETGEPVHNIGLVVNLGDKTVSFAGYTAPFTKVANVYFRGASKNEYFHPSQAPSPWHLKEMRIWKFNGDWLP